VDTELAGVPDRDRAEPQRLDRRSDDVAMLHLVRMVLDEGWSAPVAARRLLDLVDGDRRLLHRARARVVHAATERASAVTKRALTTLDLAIRGGKL
jgi:hypothetical protein